MKLKGTNNHHDGGILGAACMDYTFERQLMILKEMGCNALRMSHNPPAPELLDCADRMGFLVIDEIFDEWKHGKKKAGYAPQFEDWYARDIENWMKRDRNHPCVIAWSLGNEVVEQRREDGPEILRMLMDEASKYDTTRPFTAACNEIISANASGMSDLLGVVGYNYREPVYDDDHIKYPNRIIYGSETTIYPYQPGDRFPLRSYEEWLTGQLEPYVAGEFLWTGFDYLGEAGIGEGGTSYEPWMEWPQWPWRSANCGVIDICGFEKPGYWFRKALWSDEPLVYIAVETNPSARKTQEVPFWGWPKVYAHWNHPVEGEEIRVHVYTNCKEVELFINDKSFGMKKYDLTKEAFLTWDVPFYTGKIKAIGKDEKGSPVEYSIQTAGRPYKILLETEKTDLMADNQDISYIKARIVDENNTQVPFSDQTINFEVEGAGVLWAVGNGDPTNSRSFKDYKMETWYGQCLAVVKSGNEKGVVKLKAKAGGLPGAEITLNVK